MLLMYRELLCDNNDKNVTEVTIEDVIYYYFPTSLKKTKATCVHNYKVGKIGPFFIPSHLRSN